MKLAKTPFAAALLSLTFMASPELKAAGQESQFVLLDLDSDGRIALSEWTGGASTFEALDRDGDSIITRTEFFTKGVHYQTREERFLELDADRDGRLSSSEWKWGESTMKVLDRDGNGELSKDEFLCRSGSSKTATAKAARR